MVSMRTVVVVLLTSLALAGCSSSSSSAPTIASFTATPSSLPAGGGSVTLAWTVSGATSLSINQSVGTVTPVTTGSTSAQVTATTTFTLTATNSGGSSTGTAQATVAPSVTVSGTVTDATGNIASGETVLITSGTFSQSAVSDANGAFSVANVPTPYNATILDTGGVVASQYQGLTRPDPTLTDFVTINQTMSASVAGQLTGGAFPQTTGLATPVVFSSPQTTASSSALSIVSNGPSYSGSVSWLGPTSTTGTLYALEVHTVSDLPVDYPGYGTASNVLLQNGASYSGQTIPLSAVTSGSISGTISGPAGYPVAGTELILEPSGASINTGGYFQLLNLATTSTSFTYTTPAIPDATLVLIAAVRGTSGDFTLLKTTVSPNATGLTLSVPAPPTLSLPIDAATDVSYTTPFAWTNFTGVTFVVFTGTPTFYVVTAASTATIPDLTSSGLPLPTSAHYSWQLLGVGPATTVDAVAVPGGLDGQIFSLGYFSESVNRTFTTAPP
jgi:hypothetical protein